MDEGSCFFLPFHFLLHLYLPLQLGPMFPERICSGTEIVTKAFCRQIIFIQKNSIFPTYFFWDIASISFRTIMTCVNEIISAISFLFSLLYSLTTILTPGPSNIQKAIVSTSVTQDPPLSLAPILPLIYRR